MESEKEIKEKEFSKKIDELDDVSDISNYLDNISDSFKSSSEDISINERQEELQSPSNKSAIKNVSSNKKRKRAEVSKAQPAKKVSIVQDFKSLKELVFNIDRYAFLIFFNIIFFIAILMFYYGLPQISSFAFTYLFVALFAYIPPICVKLFEQKSATDKILKERLSKILKTIFIKSTSSYKTKSFAKTLIIYSFVIFIELMVLKKNGLLLTLIKTPFIIAMYLLVCLCLNSISINTYNVLAKKKNIPAQNIYYNLIFYLIPGAVFVLPTIATITFKNREL